MIAPALILTGVFSLIATLQVFSEPHDAAPADQLASPPTWTPLMRVYDAFTDNNIYAAAAPRWSSRSSCSCCRSASCALVSSKRVFQGR